MSEHFRPSEPFSDENPLLENTNRRGASTGEAIFGDKHAQFNTPHFVEQADQQRQHFETPTDLGAIAIGGLRINPETNLPIYPEDEGATLQQVEQPAPLGRVDGNGSYLTPSEVADLRQK